MDTPSTFAARLRLARKQVGLSQEALARAVDVSKNTVARWEAGAPALPRTESIMLLADRLGVSMPWLLTGSEAAA